MKPTEKPVPLADFKAHMSRYLRGVRQGIPLTLSDRRVPVAQVVPYPAAAGRLAVRPASRDPREVRLPAPLGRKVDVVRYAAEERQRNR
jgi:prevent-host-death family protein